MNRNYLKGKFISCNTKTMMM